ncbi:hypothetical protein Tco_1534979, partial [Tanacetum coccineum]
MAVVAMKHMASNFSKLDKFEGVDFRRCALNQEKGQNVESSKEQWDSLEAKYMAEDASNKKFLVSNFINVTPRKEKL